MNIHYIVIILQAILLHILLVCMEKKVTLVIRVRMVQLARQYSYIREVRQGLRIQHQLYRMEMLHILLRRVRLAVL